MTHHQYTTAHKGSWKWLLVILGLGIAMIVFQGVRHQRNRPLIIAEAAVADSKGDAMFEALGLPPDTTPTGPGEKQAIAKSAQAPTKQIIWRREYEAPGAFVVTHH